MFWGNSPERPVSCPQWPLSFTQNIPKIPAKVTEDALGGHLHHKGFDAHARAHYGRFTGQLCCRLSRSCLQSLATLTREGNCRHGHSGARDGEAAGWQEYARLNRDPQCITGAFETIHASLEKCAEYGFPVPVPAPAMAVATPVVVPTPAQAAVQYETWFQVICVTPTVCLRDGWAVL